MTFWSSVLSGSSPGLGGPPARYKRSSAWGRLVGAKGSGRGRPRRCGPSRARRALPGGPQGREPDSGPVRARTSGVYCGWAGRGWGS